MRAISSRRLYPAWVNRCAYRMIALAVAAVIPSSFAAAEPVYTTLHSFAGGQDGVLGAGEGLVRNGNVFYGIAAKGGKDACPGGGCGLVYALTPTADPAIWDKRTVFRFGAGSTGYRPRGQLLPGSDGALYGVASRGGLNNCSTFDGTQGCGLVYKLTPPATAGGQWSQTVLYKFKSMQDGAWPIGGLVARGSALYGTTSAGGSVSLGTAFELTPSANPAAAWTKTTVAVFQGSFGASPNAALTLNNGKFYGTTTTGTTNPGAVFELSPPVPPSKTWTMKLLHKFSAATGSFPQFVKLVFDNDGRLYGTASKGADDCIGGPAGCGVVFRLVPPSPPSTAWTYQIIRRFRPGSDGFAGKGGAVPVGGIVFDAAGAAYGVASQGGEIGGGLIYKLTPPPDDTGSWSETVLHDNLNTSAVPQAGLGLWGGFLYGTLATTFVGSGEAFRLKP